MADAKTIDPSFDPAEVEKLILKAKREGKPYAFAFGLAGKPANCALLVHLRKEPKALQRAARASSKAVQKVCFGTFTVEGNKIFFQPNRPIKGLVKQLKFRFREAGLAKYKPLMVDASGQEIDEETLPDEVDSVEDGQGLAPPDAPAQPTAAAAEPEAEGPNATDLKRRLFEARDAIAAWTGDDKAALVKLMRLAVEALDAGDLEETDATITQLTERLNGAPSAPPAPPGPEISRADLQARLKTLVPQIKALSDEKLRTTLSSKIKEAVAQMEGGQLEPAAAGLSKVAAVLAKVAPAAAPSGDADPLVIWRDAKELIDVDVSTLQNALRDVDDPNVQRIVEFGLNGITDGNQVAMMRTLMAYNGASAEARAPAGRAVLEQVSAYRNFIQNDPIISMCEANPFGVTLNIKPPILAALSKIEQAIAP